MGYLDKDRFLYVLGRFKSLLISDDGEKYSPEGIEETITDRSPFIDQLMLFNNQNKFTTALLVPNGEALARWAKNKNIDISGPQGPEAVLNELDSVIGQYRTGGQYDDLFPPRWLPSAVGVLAESFNADNKLLNSLGKMVRAKIVERYHDRIDSLYSAEARNIVNPENLAAIKKVLGIR